MFDSLKKHRALSRWQRYNVYLKVNICIYETVCTTLPVPYWGSCLWCLKDLLLMIHCSVLCFFSLTSASEDIAGFLMAAQLVFLVHLSLRVF